MNGSVFKPSSCSILLAQHIAKTSADSPVHNESGIVMKLAASPPVDCAHSKRDADCPLSFPRSGDS